MREILFRGQTRRYGEKLMNYRGDKMPSNWVEGGIFPGGGDKSIIYGCKSGEPFSSANLEKHIVYSDTVGQYTGVNDKNGKKIFEGDFVKFENEIFVVEYIAGFAAFSLRHPTNMRQAPPITTITVGRMEVIGNIYDNPELLDGRNEKG